MNKKGISEVIAYVMLIVIAMALALVVFNFLKAQLPGEEKKCDDGVSVSLISYECDAANNKISIVMKNNGLFNVHGFVLRVYDSQGLINNLQNEEWERTEGGGILNYYSPRNEPLKPGQLSTEHSTQTFDYTDLGEIAKIELEPFTFEEELIFCDNAIISQNLENCN